MAAPSAPLINGNRFDGSSVTVRINGKKYVAVQAIDYEAMVEPGFVYGTSTAVPIGRTRGQLKTDNASFEILREEYADLLLDLQSLAIGFAEANFLITVAYSEAPNPLAGTPQIDTLIGCRPKGFGQNVKIGNEAVIVKVPFTFMNCLANGVPLISLAASQIG
jgi:hypothetical protein